MQVFEAYTDPTEVTDEDTGADDGLSLEEKVSEILYRRIFIALVQKMHLLLTCHSSL